MPRSIRARITFIALMSVAAVLVVGSWSIVALQRRQVVADLDASLSLRADDLAALLEAGEIPDVLPAPAQEGFSFVVDEAGAVLTATANFGGVQPPVIGVDPTAAEAFYLVSGLPVDDDVFRVLVRKVVVDGRPAALHVATTFDIVSERTGRLVGTLALVIPPVLVMVMVLVWWLVGRTLAPVDAIRAEVEEIGESDLSRRVPDSGSGDEIGRLARTMNRMLERLESSATRQRRFVADASHEMRTPLARMRTEIEVARMDSTSDRDAVLESAHEEVVALQALIEDLLHLAGSGNRPMRSVSVDLDEIVLAEARQIRTPGAEIDVSAVSGAQVLGDPADLARLVRNLADNARRHAVRVVAFALWEEEGLVNLMVTDDGPGIPVEQAATVFERFTRLDDSRSGGGSGLGLAIAREIAERHGGSIHLDSRYLAGARLVVTLPAA